MHCIGQIPKAENASKQKKRGEADNAEMKIADLFRVDGQIAIVTGGASGIGYACAQVLADNGAKVCIFDRDAAKLDETKARLACDIAGCDD